MSYITGDGGSLIRRPDAISIDYLTCYCVGPVQQSNPSLGLLDRVWKGRVTLTGEFFLARSSITILEQNEGAQGIWEPASLVFNYSGLPIVETDMAFDQNGNIMVCAERFSAEGGAPEIWLYWFDPRVGQHVFNKLAQGRNPRLLLDAPETPEESDVLLFYISDEAGRVEMRQQRDLFEVIYPVPVENTENKFLGDVARAIDGRMHLVHFIRDTESGRYNKAHIETTPYPVRMLDSIESQISLEFLNTVDVIIEFVYTDQLTSSISIPSLEAQELIIKHTLVPEDIEANTSIVSVTREDLIVTTIITPESVHARTAPRSVTTVTYVIEVPSLLAESVHANSTIQSLTLV